MRHHVTRTPDGKYHVQNVVMGHYGQHHVHTKSGFEKWVRETKINKDDLTITDGSCECGISPSHVREYDGQVWKSTRFDGDESDE